MNRLLRISPIMLLLVPSLIFGDGLMRMTDNKQFLPLVKSEVNIEIFEQVAITTTEQTFYNDTDVDSLKVQYMFPLPENASVIQFGLFLEDSTFYEFKMTANDTAGGHSEVPEDEPELANYLRPNPFVIPFKIIPGMNRIRLKYVELLPYDFGKLNLSYPLYNDQFLVGVIEMVKIHIELTSHRAITDLSSASHAIQVNQSTSYAAIIDYSEGSTIPDRHFQFEFMLSQDEIGLFNFCYRDPADTTETDGYFLMLLEPGQHVAPDEIVQKYFTFILDRSGSMYGRKIQQAKEAAVYCVQHLNEKDLFNIIDFSSSYSKFANQPMNANAANIQSAVNYINRINATGSTNLYDPTMFALQQSLGQGTANQIILLTDGYHNTGSVINLNQVVTNITAANTQGVNIYTFGLGNAVDEGFLQELANKNHGLAFFVDEQSAVADVIGEFFLRINNPVLINIDLDFGAIAANDTYPREFQNIFVGSQLVITGRYASPGTTDITMSGSIGSADTSIVYPGIYFPATDTEFPFVPKIWAKMKIEYLYQQWLILGEPEALKNQIIALSIKYGVLSPFTQYTQPENPTAVEAADLIILSGNWEFKENCVSIYIEWTVPPATFDNISYNIYRSTTAEGNYMKLNAEPLLQPEFRDKKVDVNQVYYYKVEAVYASGEIVHSQAIKVMPVAVKNFILLQNYPNPFNSSTTISYMLPFSAHVEIQVFDVLGRSIRTLVCAKQLSGLNSVQWNGMDDQGKAIASGIYFYQLKIASHSQIGRMLYLR